MSTDNSNNNNTPPSRFVIDRVDGGDGRRRWGFTTTSVDQGQVTALPLADGGARTEVGTERLPWSSPPIHLQLQHLRAGQPSRHPVSAFVAAAPTSDDKKMAITDDDLSSNMAALDLDADTESDVRFQRACRTARAFIDDTLPPLSSPTAGMITLDVKATFPRLFGVEAERPPYPDRNAPSDDELAQPDRFIAIALNAPSVLLEFRRTCVATADALYTYLFRITYPVVRLFDAHFEHAQSEARAALISTMQHIWAENEHAMPCLDACLTEMSNTWGFDRTSIEPFGVSSTTSIRGAVRKMTEANKHIDASVGITMSCTAIAGDVGHYQVRLAETMVLANMLIAHTCAVSPHAARALLLRMVPLAFRSYSSNGCGDIVRTLRLMEAVYQTCAALLRLGCARVVRVRTPELDTVGIFETNVSSTASDVATVSPVVYPRENMAAVLNGVEAIKNIARTGGVIRLR